MLNVSLRSHAIQYTVNKLYNCKNPASFSGDNSAKIGSENTKERYSLNQTMRNKAQKVEEFVYCKLNMGPSRSINDFYKRMNGKTIIVDKNVFTGNSKTPDGNFVNTREREIIVRGEDGKEEKFKLKGKITHANRILKSLTIEGTGKEKFIYNHSFPQMFCPDIITYVAPDGSRYSYDITDNFISGYDSNNGKSIKLDSKVKNQIYDIVDNFNNILYSLEEKDSTVFSQNIPSHSYIDRRPVNSDFQI